jgi:hypothetical protein
VPWNAHCHPEHHHRLVHSDDHHGMEELDLGWATVSIKMIIMREANN